VFVGGGGLVGGTGVFVGAVVAVGTAVEATVDVGGTVSVGAPVADGPEVGVDDGVGVRVEVGGVSPGRSVRVFVGASVGKTVPAPGVGVGVNEGVELGPPPAIRVSSSSACTATSAVSAIIVSIAPVGNTVPAATAVSNLASTVSATSVPFTSSAADARPKSSGRITTMAPAETTQASSSNKVARKTERWNRPRRSGGLTF
jgi:hypothetical protein